VLWWQRTAVPPEKEERRMRMTIEAIYEAGILKPLAPLPDLPDHTRG
jgi:hypothetical protein